jgi:hypothetical protein
MSRISSLSNKPSIFVSHRNLPRPDFLPSTFRLSTLGLLLFFLIFSFQSCGLDIEDPTPPSPPQWVPKSFSEEWPERGIDAHETGGIFLEWEPNPEQEIVKYLVYRAQFFEKFDSLGDYSVLFQVEPEPNKSLSYLDREVATSTKYFYKLKAENTSNIQSQFSDSSWYSLLPRISIASMVPNGLLDQLSEDRKLSWGYRKDIEMENYCLTLIKENDDFVYRELFSPGNYVNDGESKLIPMSIILELGHIYKWRIDTGAKYIMEFETAGSESPWATFLYGG